MKAYIDIFDNLVKKMDEELIIYTAAQVEAAVWFLNCLEDNLASKKQNKKVLLQAAKEAIKIASQSEDVSKYKNLIAKYN